MQVLAASLKGKNVRMMKRRDSGNLSNMSELIAMVAMEISDGGKNRSGLHI